MAALDLCALADVKALLGLSTVVGEDADFDDLIADLITKASEQAIDRGGREFVDSSAGNTRKFDFGVYAAVRELPIGDAKTVTSLAITDAYGNELYPAASLTLDLHYSFLPRNRAPAQPIRRIRFLPYLVTLDPTWIAVVTGTWGFPALPSNLVHAVAYAVKTWMERDVRSFSQAAQAVNLEEANRVPRILPLASLDVIDAFKDYGI